jgi:DNA-binding MarR family transcriptional regulator
METLSNTETGAELAPRLRLAVMRLARLLRQHGQEGISASQLSALVTIERLQAVTLGELASVEKVQPPTMTRIVDSLEDQGLVRREPDEQDRRICRVRVTTQGRKLLERSRSRKTAFLAERLRELNPDEIEVLARAAELLERMVEQQ